MSGLCEVPDCGRPLWRRGLCGTHYKRHLKGEPLGPIQQRRHWDGPCAGPDCERQAEKNGLCPSHYSQQAKGRNLAPLRSRSNVRWAELFDQIDHSWLPIAVVAADADTTLATLERAATRHGRYDLAARARRVREAVS